MLVSQIINTTESTKLYVKVSDLTTQLDAEQVMTNTINIRAINYEALTALIPKSTVIINDEIKPILPVTI